MTQAALAYENTQGRNFGSTRIHTTLYDLVEAVMEEAGFDEEETVTRVVMGLLGRTGLSPLPH